MFNGVKVNFSPPPQAMRVAMLAKRHWQWRLDEVYVKFNG
jgi:hypothetical protein